MLSNISFKVQYIPSKRNSVADSIFVLSGWDSEIWCKMQVLGQLQFANGFGRSNGRIQEAYPQFISPRFTQDIQPLSKYSKFFFRVHHNHSVVTWPIATPVLLNFIAYLSIHQQAVSTVQLYSAIAFFHKLKGLQDPNNNFLISKALQGLKRTKVTTEN